MRTSNKGLDLIKHFEGCKLKAYQCTGGKWTIGYGATFYENGKQVKDGDVITQKRADELLIGLLVKFEQKVLSKVNRQLLQHEFDAAVSFCFNAGTSYKTKGGSWKDYDIWKNINNGLIGDEMRTYWQNLAVTAGGVKLSGLVRRRKAEVEMYLGDKLLA